MINQHFEYEKSIIDPILNLIKDNQEYLTLPENLPQLAKLGYVYNTLYYAGRICWGNSGKLRGDAKRLAIDDSDEDGGYENYYDCEENPKYKIEVCTPINEDIENLIYDAWAMHHSNEGELLTFKDFTKIIREGKTLSELEIKSLKINKTFDEWVEILTDKNYKYFSIYTNRKSVLDHLLCTIGNGYGVNKDGFVIAEAGGADQDEALYGDWQNAKFREDINTVVEKILEYPETEATIETKRETKLKCIEERNKKDYKSHAFLYERLKEAGAYKDNEGYLSHNELFDRLYKYVNSKEEKTNEEIPVYNPYYPISSSSIIYVIEDKETQERWKVKSFHQSYIDAGIEICKEILEHQEEENKSHGKDNVKFAKRFLLKQGFTEYADQVPKEIDKYELEKKIKKALKPFTSNFVKTKIQTYSDLKEGEYYYRFNNTKLSDYADNSYNYSFNLNKNNIRKGNFCSIHCMEGTPYYDIIKEALNTISQLEGVKTIKFYMDNTDEKNAQNLLHIKILRHNENETLAFEKYLVDNEFEVGFNDIFYRLNDNVIFKTHKPTYLGSKHPHTRPGMWDCFDTNKQFEAYDANNKKICDFQIDERRCNLIRANHGSKTDLSKWIITKHAELKASNSDYGTFEFKKSGKTGNDGKISLTAHDFFMYLKK